MLGQPEEEVVEEAPFPFGLRKWRTREISIISSRQQRVPTQAALGTEEWKGIYLPFYLFI